jgi:hypothetical protein
MSTPPDISPDPFKSRNFRIDVNETNGSYAATVRALYRDVDKQPDAAWLTAILQYLPVFVDSLSETDWKERMTHLARALAPHYGRVDATAGMNINGKKFLVRFFRTVPLLSDQDVRERAKNPDSLPWSDLMQYTYANRTYYYADQFEADGTINPLFLHIMKSFKACTHHFSEWEIALWWINPNGWLDSACPRDIYREDPDELTHALEQEIVQFDF